MKTGIIGSGSMGSGIAQVAATAGHDVLLYDNNPDALKRARAKLEKILARLVEKAGWSKRTRPASSAASGSWTLCMNTRTPAWSLKPLWKTLM